MSKASDEVVDGGMARYHLRLMFEWGGGCLWCGNDAAREAFDVGSVEDRLPLSDATRRRLEELSGWHDTSLDWNDPAAPGPWPASESERFDRAAAEAGVVGLGGAAFPAHVKLAPPPDARIREPLATAMSMPGWLPRMRATCPRVTKPRAASGQPWGREERGRAAGSSSESPAESAAALSAVGVTSWKAGSDAESAPSIDRTLAYSAESRSTVCASSRTRTRSRRSSRTSAVSPGTRAACAASQSHDPAIISSTNTSTAAPIPQAFARR